MVWLRSSFEAITKLRSVSAINVENLVFEQVLERWLYED
jgi:hypothetical protein